MAKKRMFSQEIVLSDDFLDMPASTRCLYFCLGMLADDDGFVNNPKSVMRQCGSTGDDFQILLSKGYIYLFETGVIVILHWKINNYLRPDRYTPTKCVAEKALLSASENGAYILGAGIPLGIPSANQPVYPDKNSIDKDSIVGADKPQNNHFVPPSLDEVTAYVAERKSPVIPQEFIDHYQSKGWMVGRNKMKDWRAACRNAEKWERWNMPHNADAGGDDFADVI